MLKNDKKYFQIDAWLAAEDHVKFSNDDGIRFSLSECHRDIGAFLKLTDYVNEKIKDSDCKPAIDILKRIDRRDLYKSVVELPIDREHVLYKKSNKLVCKEIVDCLPPKSSDLEAKDIMVIRRKVTHGMGDLDPIKRATFYHVDANKKGLEVTDPLDVEVPETSMASTIWICCKVNKKEALKMAVDTVKQWDAKHNYGFALMKKFNCGDQNGQ